jgi:hypothetical protein
VQEDSLQNLTTHSLPHSLRSGLKVNSGQAFYCGLPDERFLHTSAVTGEDGNDFDSFIKSCRKHNITYVAWDARAGALRHEYFYKLWRYDKIDVLGAPLRGQRIDAIGPCKLVQVFADGEPQITIYKILPEANN